MDTPVDMCETVKASYVGVSAVLKKVVVQVKPS